MTERIIGEPKDIVLLGLPDADVDTTHEVLRGHRVHAIGRVALLRELLNSIQPVAILSEIWVRDGHCVEVKDLLASMSPHTLMIVVASSLEDDLAALDLGSHRFLVLQRPLRRLELASIIEHAVDLHDMHVQLAEMRDAVKTLRGSSEEAIRLKSEFLSLISHELRTPLTEVIGYSELLAAGGLDPEKTAEFARNIVRSSNQLKALIEDLMMLSKAEAGALPLELSMFPADHVLQGKVNDLLRDARTRGFAVSVNIDSRAGLLTGDSAKLSKALQNLLSNAVKFSPPGGVIDLEISDAGKAVLFSVADAGKGLSQEKLRDLFLAFRQEDSSDRRQHGGLGIGLSIVKHFVELHGGSVRVTSRPDRGTVFSFVIPRRPGKMAEALGRDRG
ncbi:HAMP domain-containing histidine kinase [Candidatus Fermentibacteria bacterium]|nr:HAMP domain-containing histidine kinase [Candidatus Fermentibacteria bacterium]